MAKSDQSWAQRYHTADEKAWRSEFSRLFSQQCKENGWRRLKQGDQFQMSPAHQQATKHIDKAESLLDVGCGNGIFTLAAKMVGIKDAYGLDVSTEAVAFAKGHLEGQAKNLYWQQDVGEFIRKQTRTYEVITAFELLDQVKEPENVIKGLFEKLDEGGKLIISVANRGRIPEDHYIHLFDDERLKAMSKSCLIDGEACPFEITHLDGATILMVITKKALAIKYASIQSTTAMARFVNSSRDYDVAAGMFNWPSLMDGTAYTIRDIGDPTYYDVIHLQLCGTTFDVPRQLRGMMGRRSGTQIVAHIDYSVDMFNKFGPHPELIFDALDYADHICVVEPQTYYMLKSIMPKKSIWILPHPVPLAAFEQHRFTKEARDHALVCVHRDFDEQPGYWIFRDTGVRTVLWTPQPMPQGPDADTMNVSTYMYDEIMSDKLKGDQKLSFMGSKYMAFDAYRLHVFGRMAIELAMLGVPTIGYSTGWMQRELFPELTIHTGELQRGRELAERLVEDEDFYSAVSAHAMEGSEAFDETLAQARFLALVQSGASNLDVYQGMEHLDCIKELV